MTSAGDWKQSVPPTGHKSPTLCIAFLDDLLASSSSDNTIVLWNSLTGVKLKTLAVPQYCYVIDFSRDGNTLAGGTWEKLHLISVETWTITRTLDAHASWVRALTFSLDGVYCASASQDKLVKIWDPVNWTCVHTLSGHTNSIFGLDFSPNGKFLASGAEDMTVRVYLVSGWTLQKTWTAHTKSIACIRFQPNYGSFLVTASLDHTAKIWDLSNYTCKLTLTGHNDDIYAVGWTVDGKSVATGSNHFVKRWDGETGACLQTMEVGKGPVSWIAFSSKFMASSCFDGTMSLYVPPPRENIKLGAQRRASVSASPKMQILLKEFLGMGVNADHANEYAVGCVREGFDTLDKLLDADEEDLAACGMTTRFDLKQVLKWQKKGGAAATAPHDEGSPPPPSSPPTSPMAALALKAKSAVISNLPHLSAEEKFYSFMTHNWGEGSGNHKRVAAIVDHFGAHGKPLWFDGQRLDGNVESQITNGMDDCATVTVFVTKEYIRKVKEGAEANTQDWCQYEFTYAGRTKLRKTVVVVMEPEMLDQSKWKGPVAGRLANEIYIDFTSDEKLESVCDALAAAYTKKIGH